MSNIDFAYRHSCIRSLILRRESCTLTRYRASPYIYCQALVISGLKMVSYYYCRPKISVCLIIVQGKSIIGSMHLPMQDLHSDPLVQCVLHVEHPRYAKRHSVSQEALALRGSCSSSFLMVPIII